MRLPVKRGFSLFRLTAMEYWNKGVLDHWANSNKLRLETVLWVIEAEFCY